MIITGRAVKMDKAIASVTAIVPVYNEKQAIRYSIDKLYQFMASHLLDFEILIVESGSTDNTDKICEEISNRRAEVVVFHEERKNGFGSGLRLGVKNASKDYVWIVPVDLPFQLETLLDALELLDDYDCVLSYRAEDRRHFARKVQSFIYYMLCRVLLGIKVKSINSAFKFYRTELLKTFEIISNGWFIDAEIICRLQQLDAKIVEIPVDVLDRIHGTSKVGTFDSLGVIKEMLVFRKILKNKVGK